MLPSGTSLATSRYRWTVIAVLLAMGPAAVMRAAADPVDFERDVRPILQQHCVRCHGSKRQESGLRLDLRNRALRGGDNYAPAIVPGDSSGSPLIQFVSRDDADLQMPPEGPRLAGGDIETLRRWIDQGATWPENSPADASGDAGHWAYRPLPAYPPACPPIAAASQPSTPPTADSWSQNPIDRFVLARLAAAGLVPSPPADRRTLMRRLYFDLLGLSPQPEDVAAFVSDPNPLAYEQLVDRLLASPQFGERWARHWLDVVRFAESNGFEMNQSRPNAWRYRDYVIRAFNADKPYDQFVREQMAGDALGAGAATGFLVGGPWDQVKSPDPVLTAQQRADELHDMISTTGSAFLGMTVGCARCHSHKFDPIPQTDYYALKACLEGVQHGDRPVESVATADRQSRLAAAQAELATIESQLAAFEPLACLADTRFLRVQDKACTQQLVPAEGPALESGRERGAANHMADEGSWPTLSSGYLYWKAPPGTDVFAWKPQVNGVYHLWVSWGCGWSTHANDARYVLDRDGDLSTRGDQTEILRADQQCFADGSGDRPGKALWSGLADAGVHDLQPASVVVLRQGNQNAYVTADVVVLQQARGPAATGLPQLRVPVSRDRNNERFPPVAARFVRFEIEATNQSEPCLDELEVFTAEPDSRNIALAANGTQPTASSTLPGYKIHQLQHINDGRYGNDRSWISNEPGRGWVQLEFPQTYVIDHVAWSRDRSPQPRFEDRVPTAYHLDVSSDGVHWQTVASNADRLPPGTKVPGNAIYTLAASATRDKTDLFALVSRRRALLGHMAELSQVPVAYAGRFVQPGPTMRLNRGDPMQPREPVQPASLSQLGYMFRLPGDAPEQQRRLALAQWLTDVRNPLTARVIVNRIWQHHFGEGIVMTPSDFGVNGGRPSHPELLDWLACELLRGSDDGGDPWSLKHIHRLILMSATYRQSSQPRSEALSKDAASRLLWRFPPRRLEAEAVRDMVLELSGQLDLRMGGPGFDLFEPNTNYVKVYTPKHEFGPDEFRRMVYQTKPRMQLDDTFGAFDCPDAGQVTPRRTHSTTPLQALNLLNSPFMLQQAAFFAERLQREAGSDPEAQITRAFQLAFARAPDGVELAASTELIRGHGLRAFCRAILNTSELIMME